MKKSNQVRNHLLAVIQEDLHPHDQLPTERDLAEQFGVSRMTVRAALDALERERRIYRVQGSGTFVAAPDISKTMALTSFSEDMRARGLVPGAKVLEASLVLAGEALGEALGVDVGAEIVHLQRLRTADGVPLCIEDAYLPHRLVPALLGHDLSASLYDLLRTHYRIVVDRADQTIQAVALREREAKLLGAPLSSPALLVQRMSFDGAGRRVERVQSLYRGDRYAFALTQHAAPFPASRNGDGSGTESVLPAKKVVDR